MKWFKEQEFWCKCNRCQNGDPEIGIHVGGMMGGVPENVKALVKNVLDPAREAYGGPIYVNSGYRCPRHNAEVGGVARSQHLVGEAADVVPIENGKLKIENLQGLARIIVENGRFDQLIIYPTFIHVSWKRVGINRHRIITRNQQ